MRMHACALIAGALLSSHPAWAGNAYPIRKAACFQKDLCTIFIGDSELSPFLFGILRNDVGHLQAPLSGFSVGSLNVLLESNPEVRHSVRGNRIHPVFQTNL